MPRESYFITPKRLSNPLFWKTVDMLAIVSPDFTIVMPPATYPWIRNYWNKISPENAAMCLESANRFLSYDWESDLEATVKILTICFNRNKGYRNEALRNRYMPEEVITSFIKGELKQQIEAVDPKKSRYDNRVDLRYTLKNLKTCQIELIWQLTPEHAKQFVLEEFQCFGDFNQVPDYIFLKILQMTVKDVRRSGIYKYDCIFQEAFKRKMLKIVVPDIETVASTEKEKV